MADGANGQNGANAVEFVMEALRDDIGTVTTQYQVMVDENVLEKESRRLLVKHRNVQVV